MSDLTIKLFGRMIAFPATLEAQAEIDEDYPTQEETTMASKNREKETPKNSDDKEEEEEEEEEENDWSTSQQEKKDPSNSPENKPLKKPEKIVRCPRCNSLETKFCYFNNYNVNQPRHFCKNCQRYWTNGGTMRNVPVGAGRRKNKTYIASQYRHLTVPDEHIHHTHLAQW